MDLHSYFKSASSSHQSCSTSIDSSSSSIETESDKSTEPSPPKRHCTSTSKAPVKSSIVRQYNKKWEEKCSWLLYDEDCQGMFSNECKKLEGHCKELEVHGSQSPSLTGRRHWKNLRLIHSDIHV